jgi:hypothetical protein
MIYYEDGDRCGLHFPNGGMPIEEFQAKRNNLFANETN